MHSGAKLYSPPLLQPTPRCLCRHMHAHMRIVTVHNASNTYIEEQLSLTICYENRKSIRLIVDGR